MQEMNLFHNIKLLEHYEGELGVFDYDSREFVIGRLYNHDEYLHYCGKGKSVDLPEGCVNVRHMFEGRKLPDGFTLGTCFDTSNVTDMSYMFYECELPEGFTLGEKFDTSNVTNMADMFHECTLPDGFTLGSHFDTSNVVYMDSMFENCKLPNGFSLGEKFNTGNVTNMAFMFNRCNIPEDFSLGEKFDTSNVICMLGMFYECKLPEGFSLGERFDTSNVTDMSWMFFECKMSDGFVLGEKFNTSKIHNMRFMFSDCKYGGRNIYKYLKTNDDKEVADKLRNLPVNPADSLLLVIDMQNVYSKGEAWECQNYGVALENILKILKSNDYYDIIFTRYLAAKNPTGVWSNYNKQYADINADRLLNEIDYRLLSLQDRCIYNKSVYSAYSIDKVREEAACTGKVVVTGVVAECCVLSTVMDLIDAGVYVIYLKDAIAGINNETEAATLKILEGLAPLHLSIMSTDEYLGVSKNSN